MFIKVKIDRVNEYGDEFGLGTSVVLNLASDLLEGIFSLYIDNYFLSLLLLKMLTPKNTGCTGTVKSNIKYERGLSITNQKCTKVSKRTFLAFKEEASKI